MKKMEIYGLQWLAERVKDFVEFSFCVLDMLIVNR